MGKMETSSFISHGSLRWPAPVQLGEGVLPVNSYPRFSSSLGDGFNNPWVHCFGTDIPQRC